MMKILDNLSMIVAMTKKEQAIGKDNKMLFHLPEDLKYYKDITSNNYIIVGYNTYLSFPFRPLPNRVNIVLSRKVKEIEGAVVFSDINKLLTYIEENPDKKFFVSGGDSVYKQFLAYSKYLYITKIDEEKEADTFFPRFNEDDFEIVYKKEALQKKELGIDYDFFLYKRK